MCFSNFPFSVTHCFQAKANDLHLCTLPRCVLSPVLCTFYLDNKRTKEKTMFLYVGSTAASHVNISFPPMHSDLVYFFKHFGFF